MALLGVLNGTLIGPELFTAQLPIAVRVHSFTRRKISHTLPKELQERIRVSALAVHTVTALLQSALLWPQPGNRLR